LTPPPGSPPHVATASTFTLGEILSVVTPIIVALSLIAWFFIQRWLNTYQHGLDDSIKDMRTRMENLEKRQQTVDENVLEFQKSQMGQCRNTHDGVNREIQALTREISEFSQKVLFRTDFERDRLTLEKQGEAILAMVQEIAEDMPNRTPRKSDDDAT
jgi:biopolymer transport protein ExbB/TolQ